MRKKASENCVNCWKLLINVLRHNVIGNNKRDGLKSKAVETISSQAAWKQVEGSTIRAWSLRPLAMAVKPQECATRKGRYDLSYRETCRDGEIKKAMITKLIGVPYTGKYDDLSEQPVKEIIHQILKRDCKETLDIAVATEFAKTPLRVVPSSGNSTYAVTLTTNGTATLTNSIAMGKEHVKTIVDLMKERDIPAYTDDDYYCIAWPTTLRTFKNDLEGVKQYTETGFGHIMRGEVGRYENCRFTEQTNVPKTSLSTAGAAWTNALSNWAVFFGADTVAEAIAVPEQIRGKLPLDYGRDKGIAWYALLGYGICHTAADQARIVLWDSAA